MAVEVPAKNEIAFVWFNNYAGVIIKTPSQTLVIDPVDVKPKTFQHVDAILVTHEHYDHLDQSVIYELYKMFKCMVLADPTSAKRLRNIIPAEKLREVQQGSEVKIGEVSVKAEKCNHPPAATPVTFVITSEDGVKVFHTADSLPFPEMADVAAREKFDIVFCTVGIAPGSSPATGFEIARLTKPRVAVPYHTGSTADLRKFADMIKKNLPNVSCIVPEIGKTYSVSKKV
jgi:L-ascorbate metabolism protein UlaG (beta-lactamase superfamily)